LYGANVLTYNNIIFNVIS